MSETTTPNRQTEAPAASAARTRVPFARHAVVQAATLLRSWSRDPGFIVQALVFPVFMLIIFQMVLGKTVTAMGAGGSIYGNAGLVALASAMFGTLATGLTLVNERETGLLSRMWTLPVPRAGFIAGRLLAEVARTLAATVLLFAFATLFGFRFTQGVGPALGALLIPAVFTVGFAAPVIALAVRGSGSGLIQQLSGACLLLLFFNTGFSALRAYPGWLQPVVEYQPLSPAIDAMRALTEGGAVAGPLAATVAWAAASLAIFGPLAVRGYRKAAEGV
jgi:ABC-2 type transport system permease protein